MALASFSLQLTQKSSTNFPTSFSNKILQVKLLAPLFSKFHNVLEILFHVNNNLINYGTRRVSRVAQIFPTNCNLLLVTSVDFDLDDLENYSTVILVAIILF